MFINGFPIIMRLTLRTGDLNFFARQAHPTRLPIHSSAELKEKGDIFWLE